MHGEEASAVQEGRSYFGVLESRFGAELYWDAFLQVRTVINVLTCAAQITRLLRRACLLLSRGR